LVSSTPAAKFIDHSPTSIIPHELPRLMALFDCRGSAPGARDCGQCTRVR
jgi:hypothetical protein